MFCHQEEIILPGYNLLYNRLTIVKLVILSIFCVFYSSHALSDIVKGTSVNINPPADFMSTDRFSGFINKNTGSSIMVSEIPGPFSEVTSGFSQQEKMQSRGMRLLDKSSITINDRPAVLLHVEQNAEGTLYKKWLLAVDQPGSTVLIVATYPDIVAKQQEEALKSAILSVTFAEQKPINPVDALLFKVKPELPFQIAKVMGQNLILSPGGKYPIQGKTMPFMIIGLSLSENLNIPDKKKFAEKHIMQTATVKNININKISPVTIGNLQGYVTLAQGQGKNSEIPLILYHVVLYDISGYSVILGITPSDQKETYLATFDKIASSFVLK